MKGVVEIMYRIGVLDNSILSIEKINIAVKNFFQINKKEYRLEEFSSLISLREKTISAHYDILIIEIYYETSNTILLLSQQLNTISPETQIIFTTSYPIYFRQVYVCNHTYCLLKNELEIHLPLALNKAYKQLTRISNIDVINIIFNRVHYILSINDIYYLEKNHRKICFNCNNIEKYLSIEEITTRKKLGINLSVDTYSKFDKLITKLPLTFVQIHRSFIVNLNYVKKIDSNSVFLLNGDILPLSRGRHKYVEIRFKELFILSEIKKDIHHI